jgi:AraC-like DNA-binding protein
MTNMEPTHTNDPDNDPVLDPDPGSEKIEDAARQRHQEYLNARRAKFMRERWNDPEWSRQTKAKMRERRSDDRIKAKMRKSQWGAAKRRADETGVIPHWAPKTVKVLETNGKWQSYHSVRACAQHYGISENHLRGIFKRGGEWRGMKFVKE